MALICMGFFGLTSFSTGHQKNSSVTITASAINNTLSNPVTVTYYAISGTTLTPAAGGGSQSNPITYDDVDGFSIDVNIGGIHGSTKFYSHIYSDNVFIGTQTHTAAHPLQSFLVVSNPASTIQVVCDSNP